MEAARDGRLCMSNNAAEREIRPLALGRRNWTFAGSDAGGHRAAAIYTLIQTARLNDVDPQKGSRRCSSWPIRSRAVLALAGPGFGGPQIGPWLAMLDMRPLIATKSGIWRDRFSA
jgi:hypothetical protein